MDRMMADENVAEELRRISQKVDHHDTLHEQNSQTLSEVKQVLVDQVKLMERLTNTRDQLDDHRAYTAGRFEKQDETINEIRNNYDTQLKEQRKEHSEQLEKIRNENNIKLEKITESNKNQVKELAQSNEKQMSGLTESQQKTHTTVTRWGGALTLAAILFPIAMRYFFS